MYYIGIDLGGTSIKAGIVDKEGSIICRGKVKTVSTRHYSEIIADMAGLAKSLVEDMKIGFNDIAGIGIGVPGSVDSASGVVSYSNNLGWDNVPVLDELKKHLPNISLFISNDANVAALGEATFGAGKEYGDSVLITLGTGVGGGIIIWDRMFEGNKSAGAELGHMVIQVGGEKCTCGRRGCFEAYSSATALIRDTKRAMEKNPNSLMWENTQNCPDNVDGTTAFECAKHGDESAQEVVNNYIKYLGEGIVNIANVLRPEMIMIGGGISAQGDSLIKPLQEYIDKNAYGGKYTPRVLVKVAKLGNDAGIVGAATLPMKLIQQ